MATIGNVMNGLSARDFKNFRALCENFGQF